MKIQKLLTVLVIAGAAWHLLSALLDAQQCRLNLQRWQTAPTRANLIKLLVAKGVLIKDIDWLL